MLDATCSQRKKKGKLCETLLVIIMKLYWESKRDNSETMTYSTCVYITVYAHD